MSDLLTVILVFSPSLLYALAGLLDARNKGEEIDSKIFIKTLAVGAVSAGIISQTQSGLLIEVTSSTLITTILDKALNSLLNKK